MSHMRSKSPTKQSLLTNDRPCSSRPTMTIGCLPPTILWLRLYFVRRRLPRNPTMTYPRLSTGLTRVCSLARVAKEEAMSNSSNALALRRSFMRLAITFFSSVPDHRNHSVAHQLPEVFENALFFCSYLQLGLIDLISKIGPFREIERPCRFRRAYTPSGTQCVGR